MFRKRKTREVPLDLPPPPTAEQIFKDLESIGWKNIDPFPEDLSPNSNETKASSPKSKESLNSWWKEFERVVQINQQLEIVKKEIGDAKGNLNDKQTELSKEATKLKDDIQQLQETIETALNEYNEFTNKMKKK